MPHLESYNRSMCQEIFLFHGTLNFITVFMKPIIEIHPDQQSFIHYLLTCSLKGTVAKYKVSTNTKKPVSTNN
jgi:hypothetical protein